MSDPAPPISPPQPASPLTPVRWATWAVVGISLALVAGFFLLVPRYGPIRADSPLGWLAETWNKETDYEHGWIFPILIAGLLSYRFKDLRNAVGKGSWQGLLVVIFGTLLYAAAYRTLQARIAVGALPIILWGGAWYLWGWRLAKLLAFPLFFFWLSIPLPSFQQATTGLQQLAATLTYHGAALFGVETIVKGTDILPVHGNWEALSIAGGCSGIRSLMALLMISAAWAYVAPVSLWKKAILLLSAIPLAIFGNALRVTSIFVIAEYGNAEWARGTWHDWSGLCLFYPISLILLLCLHTLLEGGLPWRRTKRQVTRNKVTAPSTSTRPQS